MYVANVGDSRAVLCQSGKAYRVSVDHRPLSVEERERVRRDGGIVSIKKIDGRIELLNYRKDYLLLSIISIV